MIRKNAIWKRRLMAMKHDGVSFTVRTKKNAIAVYQAARRMGMVIKIRQIEDGIYEVRFPNADG